MHPPRTRTPQIRRFRRQLVLVVALASAITAFVGATPANAAPFHYGKAKLVISVKGHGALVAVSARGNRILYAAGPAAGAVHQLYMYDRSNGTRRLVSATPAGHTAAGGWVNTAYFVGDDLVAFTAEGPGLAPGVANYQHQVYLKNLRTGALQILSATATGVPANGGESQVEAVDPTSRKVLIVSDSSNLAPSIAPETAHLYVKSLATGHLDRVDFDSAGKPIPGTVSHTCTDGLFTHGGAAIAMNCWGSGYAPGSTGPGANCFLRNLTSGTVRLITADSDGKELKGTYSNCDAVSPNNARFLMLTEPGSVYKSAIKNVGTGKVRWVNPPVALMAPDWSRRASYGRDSRGQDQYLAQPIAGKFTQRLTVNHKGVWANRGCSGQGFTSDGRKYFWSTNSTNMPGHLRGHFEVYLDRSKS